MKLFISVYVSVQQTIYSPFCQLAHQNNDLETLIQENDFNSHDEFFFFVDSTPPKITNCPTDKLIMTSKLGEIVSWNTPTFYDAVGVARTELPSVTSGSFWSAGQSAFLQYRVYDAAGNSAKCGFKVEVRSM